MKPKKPIKERYYIKDKYDGNEHCLSGDTSFYLIDVTEEVLKWKRKDTKRISFTKPKE